MTPTMNGCLASLLLLLVGCSTAPLVKPDGSAGGSVGADTGGSGAADTGGSANGSGGRAVGTGGIASGGLGTGGAISTGGQPGSKSCGELIDDFEDGNGDICAGSGRRGSWYTVATSNDEIVPPPTISPTPTHRLTVARGSSKMGIEVYSPQNVLALHPALGVFLNRSTTQTGSFDASGYQGIQVWVNDGSLCYFHAEFGTPATVPVARGGQCSAGCVANKAPNFQTPVGWTLLQIPFSRVLGGNQAFDPSQIVNIEFVMNQSTFDCVLDDISFY